MSGDSHPARKVDKDELRGLLKDWNEDVPALTTKALAGEFPNAESQTVGNNLEELAEEDTIRVYSDGKIRVWWYPRPGEDGGAIKHSELVDDSIKWDEFDVTEVPKSVAQEIASERLPNHREITFWSQLMHASQLGLMVSFGMVILGIGSLVGGTLGISQDVGGLIFIWGLRFSVVALVGFVSSILLDNLSAGGYVTKHPLGSLSRSD